jgi:hypothetical protein
MSAGGLVRTCRSFSNFYSFSFFFFFLDFSLFNMCLDSDRSVNIFLALEIM